MLAKPLLKLYKVKDSGRNIYRTECCSSTIMSHVHISNSDIKLAILGQISPMSYIHMLIRHNYRIMELCTNVKATVINECGTKFGKLFTYNETPCIFIPNTTAHCDARIRISNTNVNNYAHTIQTKIFYHL